MPGHASIQPVDNPCRVIDDAEAVATAYAYELRSGEKIISTGRLTAEHELGPGDQVTVAGIVARVEELSWANGEPRLILQPSRGLTPR